MKITALVIIFALLIIHLLRPEKKPKRKEKRQSSKRQSQSPEPEHVPQKDLKPTYHQSLTYLLGEKIEQVYYVIVNKPYATFEEEDYHFCDQGVLIQFSNKKWLNWVWEEDGVYGKPEFQLSFSDKRAALKDEFTKIISVENRPAWKDKTGTTLLHFDIKYATQANNQRFLSDLMLTFPSQSVTIRAVTEPYPQNQVNPETLSFSTDWIMLKFEH